MSDTSRKRSFRVVLMGAVIAIAGMVGAVLTPSAAFAETISLSGTVHNDSGAVVAGVTITAYDLNTLDSTTVTTSSSTGAFSFTGLQPNQYVLGFGATSSTFAQYLGNTTVFNLAQSVSLTTGGGDHSYLGVVLSNSGTVSGTVSKMPSGAVPGLTVRAYIQAADGTWSVDRSAKTASNGTYSITGLQPGQYRLEALDATSAHPAYAASYSGEAADLADATAVGVLASKSTPYNFSVGKAGSVSGTVTGDFGGANPENLGGVHVTVYRLVGTAPTFTSAVTLDSPSTTTASNGTYTISGLTPGNYTLEFAPPTSSPFSPSGTQYGRSFLGGALTAISAANFTIGRGTAISAQNIEMSAGGELTGTVDEAGCTPISNCYQSDVRIYVDYAGNDPDLQLDHASTTLSDSTGNFTIAGLAPGNYNLYAGSNVGDPNAGITTSVRVELPETVTLGTPTPIEVDLAEKGQGLLATTPPHVNTPSGSALGDTVTVTPATWNQSVDPASIHYQWVSADNTPIEGATGTSYTLTAGDLNDYVNVIEYASSFGYGDGYAYSDNNTGAVQQGTLASVGSGPYLAGTPTMGDTLTVNPGQYNASGVTFEYFWEVSTDNSNWNPIGVTTATHTITSSDVQDGPYIRAQVVAYRNGYGYVVSYAYPQGQLANATLTMTKAPTVVKTSSVFELTGGTWSPSAHDSISYQWTQYDRNGNYVNGTTAPSFPVAGTAGDLVTVIIRHNLAGYTSTWSNPITAQVGGASTYAGSTAMTGTPQVDQQLQAPNLSWDPSTGSTKYEWEYLSGSTWKVISGQAGQDYTPGASLYAHHIRVIETRTSPGWTTTTVVSTAATPIAIGAAPGYLGGGSSGTSGTLDTLAVSSSSWTITPTKVSYQWESAASFSGPYTKITGATASSYSIPQSMLGKYLAVQLTTALAGHTAGGFLQHFSPVSADKLSIGALPKVTHVGTTYTASGATFSPAADPTLGVIYRWYYVLNSTAPQLYSSDEPSLNSDSLDIGATPYPNAFWYVLAIGNKTVGTQYNPTAGPAVTVKTGTMGPSGAITLPTPTTQVGQSVTPGTITWYAQNPVLSYQWQYETSSKWYSISGATGNAYVPGTGLVGHDLRVVVTAKQNGYSSASVTSGVTLITAGPAPTPGTVSNAPEINGYLGIGQTLTALPGTWSMTGLTYHYQWSSSPDQSTWTNIAGATVSTYLIPDAAFNALYYRVTITASKTGYLNGTATVAETSKPTDGQFRLLKSPVATYKSGTYTISTGTWSPTGIGMTPYSYDWEAFDPATDSSVQVSTSSTYTPAPADASKEIEVTVYPNRDNYNTLGSTIIVHQGPTIEPTSPLTLSGTPEVGDQLQVSSPGWNTWSPQVFITWYRNGVATGTNINSFDYVLGAADFGKTITAKVSAVKTGYGSFTQTLSASGPTFTNVAISNTALPTISGFYPGFPGTVPVDGTITASTGTWDTAGLTYTYQWSLNGSPILGATAATYVVNPADEYSDLAVTVTAHKAYYNTSSAVSLPVTVTYGLTPVNLSSVPLKITGTPKLGSVLTATVGAWNMPVSVSYQWSVYDTASSSWQEIFGATSSTYTPSATDTDVAVGAKIEVYIFATRPGHAGVEFTSAPITITG